MTELSSVKDSARNSGKLGQSATNDSSAQLSALRRALDVERRGRYSDFQGRRTIFSKFMREQAHKLAKRYPYDSRWSTIRGLFQQYPNLDVATRIQIIRRVTDLLELSDLVKEARQPTPSRKPEVTVKEESSVLEKTVEKKRPSSESKKAPEEPKQQLSDKDLDEIDVQFVKGVGPKVAKLLNNLDIYTVEDLLRHYPRQHLDFKDRVLIRDLKPGDETTVIGTVRSVSAFQSKNRNIAIVTASISDGSGSITINKFIGGKSNKFLLDRYKDQWPKGAQVMASGRVERDKYKGSLELKNAQVEVLGELVADGETIDSLHVGRLVPIYPLTEGLGLRHLRTVIHNALEKYGHLVQDHLPETIRKSHDFISLDSALKQIHFPESLKESNSARSRLVFDELFRLQLALAVRRYRSDIEEAATALEFKTDGLINQFRKSLPFQLTDAQERVFREITRDLSSTRPMHRLVQGDVGSGKTVVALMSLLIAIENGFQGAMMAPTEILAEQHFRQFQRYLTPLGLKAALLVGKQGVKERRLVQEGLLNGQIHIAVGTHALIQDGVEFKNLGLIIIDEQHRFGVKQRAKLRAKGHSPQLLTMTATPIPRTLALAVHGDLDVSEIDQLPPGRKAIETKLVRPSKRGELFEFMERQIKLGRQAYVVFPLIEESETLSAKAATIEYEKLQNKVFPDLNIGLMHGKLKPQEKDMVMDAFRKGEYQILVSTTVIEVGVDVPNATVMVIENADRFGLAQLHQLRGRVGRGAEQSYCFLVADAKSEQTRQRLSIMEETNDGFVVAQKDLELRGPGEIMGTRQSGLPDLMLADIVNDAKILEDARHLAIEIVKDDPWLKNYPGLAKLLEVKSTQSEVDELLTSG